MTETLTLTPGQLTLGQLRRISRESGLTFALDPACKPAIDRSAETVAKVLEEGRTVYGINTGFGLLASTSIPADQLETLQRNLVLSHAAGVGEPLSDATVRLILALKIGSLAQGHSGVRAIVIDALLALLQADALPVIPSKGSVGASGDLAPLAHMSAAILGIGHVRIGGETLPAADGLKKIGLEPLTLGPKEGLALLNGTQVSTALALEGLFAAEDLFAAAMAAGALSVDAAMGTDTPFDPRIHEVRGQHGQIATAAVYRELLSGSEIRNSHEDCERVQDPYSLRCQPQVMGACLDHINFASEMFLREANAVSDNPLVFPDNGDILSGGNFHAEPVAMAADTLALAIAEIGALSERRIALLIDPHLSELPPFLTPDSGVNSGFMIAQVTAAALASENKTLAHPASVDSLPTSANQEDHVSMATFAARRLGDMSANTAGVLAVELLAAAQGIDFRAPLNTSEKLSAVMKLVRDVAAFYDKDRYFSPDIESVTDLIRAAQFRPMMPNTLLPSMTR